MHLKVNGTSIPLHGKFEIDLFMDECGEQLPEGSVVRIHGGALKLHGRPEGPGLTIVYDELMQIHERYENPGIALEPARAEPAATRYWPGNTG